MMPGKPFDATTKDLIQSHSKDWLTFLGLPVNGITITDADLSTVSPDADKIIVVDADPPYIAHLEWVQSVSVSRTKLYCEQSKKSIPWKNWTN
jgi:hypothetical protein